MSVLELCRWRQVGICRQVSGVEGFKYCLREICVEGGCRVLRGR